VRREGIVAERAANSGQLARRDAGADSAAADQDAAIGLPADDGATDRRGDVGVVVARHWMVGTTVDDVESP
jgi:hypothetical protein